MRGPDEAPLLSSPVVDVAPRADVPALDGVPHLLHDLVSPGLLHGPGVWPVEHDVGQHPARVVGHLDAIRLTVQKLAEEKKKRFVQS